MSSAIVQVANPPDRSITIQTNNRKHDISSYSNIPENVAGTVEVNSLESAQARTDLAVALGKSFKDFNLNSQLQVYVLHFRTKHQASYNFFAILKRTG